MMLALSPGQSGNGPHCCFAKDDVRICQEAHLGNECVPFTDITSEFPLCKLKNFKDFLVRTGKTH